MTLLGLVLGWTHALAGDRRQHDRRRLQNVLGLRQFRRDAVALRVDGGARTRRRTWTTSATHLQPNVGNAEIDSIAAIFDPHHLVFETLFD